VRTLQPMTTHADVEPRPALRAELHRQIDALIERGHPAAAGLQPAQLRERLAGLDDVLARRGADDAADYPFVLVITSELVPAARAIELVQRREKTATCMLDDDDLARFEPIDTVELPPGAAYLMFDVSLGLELRNVTPDDALETIDAAGRSPLTIDEGIALVTQFPEAVAKNAGFSLAGSRCGDRRVCALWISENRPKLGWCWAGNPHTWLGTASCAGRAGVPVPG
jgi:hypothetical protein